MTVAIATNRAPLRQSPSPILAVLAWLATLLALGCGPATPDASPNAPPPNRPLRIVCTTAMVADVVQAIAGDLADVTTLMGPGVDPHLYRPTRDDVAAIMAADAVFYNGLLLEGKMTDTLVRAASGGRTVWPITELIPEDSLLSPDGAEGHHDPHVWMDPVAWRQTIRVVEQRLAERLPAHTQALADRAADYEARVDRLHEYAARVLATIPQDQRLLLTSHDAFNYFGRRYDLEVLGIQGLSTESEAGVRDIERLVNTLATRRVRAVFVETTVSDRNIRALIDGAAARGHSVAIGGSLFSDAMGPPGTYEGTYIGMLDHNITTVARALGGDAPDRGMDGLLSSGEPAP